MRFEKLGVKMIYEITNEMCAFSYQEKSSRKVIYYSIEGTGIPRDVDSNMFFAFETSIGSTIEFECCYRGTDYFYISTEDYLIFLMFTDEGAKANYFATKSLGFHPVHLGRLSKKLGLRDST